MRSRSCPRWTAPLRARYKHEAQACELPTTQHTRWRVVLVLIVHLAKVALSNEFALVRHAELLEFWAVDVRQWLYQGPQRVPALCDRHVLGCTDPRCCLRLIIA